MRGFARDWAAFRRQAGDKLPWSIVAHSMGALLARSLVEDDATWAHDVSSMILIAPVNQGSNLARVQTVLQLLNGLQSINEKKTSKAMMHLSDGLGQAAQDMLPGSSFLSILNRRPRRQGLPYHMIAGDSGVLTRDARAQIEARVNLLNRNSGLFGRLTQAATADLPEILEELTDGTGDGCVAVKRTRLEGVDDPVILRANHAELIRAPLLFADPGPVACMPDVLRWLKADALRANPETSIEEVLGLIRRRMVVMHDVARAKWNTRTPAEDPIRERILLDEVEKKGRALGLDPEFTRAFFAAQIDASKLIQNADFRLWESERRGRFVGALDLKRDLRPRIDGLNTDLLKSLAKARPLLRHREPIVRRLAEKILAGEGIDAKVRDTAIRPITGAISSSRGPSPTS